MELIVKQRSDGLSEARYGDWLWPCAIGRGGLRSDKREGDGATPIGSWPIRFLFYRADRVKPPPEAHISKQPLRPSDGWCDDPFRDDYNLLVRLPFAGSHEVLWREDQIYDLITVLGYNDAPPQAGKGSAIFLHVAKADYKPTQGCVALAREHLLLFLGAASPDCRVTVCPPP